MKAFASSIGIRLPFIGNLENSISFYFIASINKATKEYELKTFNSVKPYRLRIE